MDIKEKLLQRKAVIGVIGLGYVGLPIAVELASKGYTVIGIDINEQRVSQLKRGESYIIDVSSEEIAAVIGSKLLVSTDFKRVEKTDCILICVPTPLNEYKEPDVSYIVNVMDNIIPYIPKEVLIVLESTTYPGTTEDLITKRIEKEKGWEKGKDFYVCYSPERVDPGNPSFYVSNTPKVIGGETENSLELGSILYRSFIDKVRCVSSTKVAEMSKLLENTFRCVNIAMINEMAMMCEKMNIDIWEVIEGASTKPFGFMPFYPGPGIGGHCIPLDPLYLSWQAKKYDYFNRFIELATDINSNMPRYTITQIESLLNAKGKCIKGSKVLLLGITYKKDIDDLRESPALKVYDLLLSKGAMLTFYDSYAKQFRREEEIVYSVDLTEEILGQMDLVVILTEHSNIDYKWVHKHAKLIFDTKNAMKGIKSDKLFKLGQNIEVFK